MKSDREWRYWGQADPLFGVNTRSDKRADLPSAWTDDEFLATGGDYFAAVADQWRQYGMGNRRCIEIGCGSARITGPLLDSFESVVAIDVSPHQVESARRLLGPRSTRVSFFVVERPAIPVDDESCDGFFSCECFQHFSDASGVTAYLDAAYPKLVPGATVCFQLPVRGVHKLSRRIDRVRTATTGLQRLLGRRAIMDFHFYDADTVFAAMEGAGFNQCQLRAFQICGHAGRHAYFFGRKPFDRMPASPA